MTRRRRRRLFVWFASTGLVLDVPVSGVEADVAA